MGVLKVLFSPITWVYTFLFGTIRATELIDELPTIVIVGASFAGLQCVRMLEANGGFNIIVIDEKDYFEYTPGILRTFVEPKHASKLIFPIKDTLKKSHFIQGRVTEVQRDKILITNMVDDTTNDNNSNMKQKEILFEYIIFCTGSRYTYPIRPKEEEIYAIDRIKALEKHAQMIAGMKSIAITGGGIVGVELAAEIIDKYPKKEVILFSRSNKLLATLPNQASNAALTWLVNKGVKVKLGSSLLEQNKNNNNNDNTIDCITSNGERFKVDYIYDCTGIKPATDYSFKLSSDLDGTCINAKGYIETNQFLQLKNLDNLPFFAAGDVASCNSAEIKSAHVAELTAEGATKSVINYNKIGSNRMQSFPKSVVGYHTVPEIFCISLGQSNGILVFNNLILSGFIGSKIAASMKGTVESTKIMQMKQQFVGKQFWAFNHFASDLMNKYVLKKPLNHLKTQ